VVAIRKAMMLSLKSKRLRPRASFGEVEARRLALSQGADPEAGYEAGCFNGRIEVRDDCMLLPRAAAAMDFWTRLRAACPSYECPSNCQSDPVKGE